MILAILALAVFIAGGIVSVLSRPAGLVAWAALLANIGGILLVINRWI